MFFFSSSNRRYMRDIYDNVDSVIDLIDTYKEVCQSVENTHSSSQEFKMNHSMYFLTIISSIFVPLTFLAGTYALLI